MLEFERVSHGERLNATPRKRLEKMAGKRGRKTSEETKRILSERAKASWQDPEKRARRMKALKDKWLEPEYCEKMEQAGRRRWQDPEFRRKNIERMMVAKGYTKED